MSTFSKIKRKTESAFRQNFYNLHKKKKRLQDDRRFFFALEFQDSWIYVGFQDQQIDEQSAVPAAELPDRIFHKAVCNAGTGEPGYRLWGFGFLPVGKGLRPRNIR